MSNNDMRAVVDINVSGAVTALGKAKNAFRDLAAASDGTGKAMTASQKSAATKIIASYKSLEVAQQKLVNETRESNAKIHRLDLKAVQDRKETRAKMEAVTANTALTGAKTTATTNNGVANVGLVTARTDSVISSTVDNKAVAESKVVLNNNKAITEEKRQQIMVADAAARRTNEGVRNELALRKQVFREQQALNREQDSGVEGLSAMRYQLYDVARVLSVAGIAMAAIAVASVGTAISFERDFANVERTVEGSTTQIAELRKEFIGLSQTIPVTFEELTKIGTLAGQMGIARESVVNFTSVVAQFGATTGVSVDDSATAFGRLNALLPDVQGNFTKLADSVLSVGVNSVATEGQILKITTQLSSIAGAVGYSSTEIIGLSGALASVAVPPELARGVFTRVFGKVTQSVATGGVALERWGQLAGMSGDQFKAAWNEDASGTFVKIMGGIQDAGVGAAGALAGLGITSVRDVPILTRLAGALDSTGVAFDSATGKGGLLVQTLFDAANASGVLSDQYGHIAETIASKLLLVQGSIAGLFDAIGSGSLGAFGYILDSINDKLKALTEFASGDFGWILGVAAAITALGGVLLIGAGFAALGLAGYIALTQAMVGMSVAAPPAGLSLGYLNAQMAATGPIGRVAAGAIRAVSLAMKALGLITLVLALPEIAGWAKEGLNNIRHLDEGFTATLERLKKGNKKTKEELEGGFNIPPFNMAENIIKARTEMDDFTRGLGRTMADLHLDFGLNSWSDIKRLDEGIAEVITNGNYEDAMAKLAATSKSSGVSVHGLMKTLSTTSDVIEDNGLKLKKLSDGQVILVDSTGKAVGATGDFIASQEDAAAATEEVITMFEDYQKAVSDTSLDFTTTAGAYDKLNDASRKSAEQVAANTESTEDSWEDFIGRFPATTQGFIDQLQLQVDAQNAWEADMTNLSTKVSSNTLAELAKLGPEGAPLIKQLTTASATELATIEDLFAQGGTNAAAKYAASLIQAQQVLTDASALIGEAASAELMTKIIAGEQPFNDILASYGVGPDGKSLLKVDADTAPAAAKVNAARKNAKAKVDMPVDAATTTAKRTLDTFRVQEESKPLIFAIKYAPSVFKPDYVDPNAQYKRGGFTGGQFATGGYTGDGGMYKPAGVVHKGEFVFTKKSVDGLGTSYLYNLMRAGSKGYAGGGSVNNSSNSYVPSFGGGGGSSRGGQGTPTIQVVEFSARSLAALERMGNPTINLDGRVLTNNNNAASLVATKRGKN